MLGYEKVISQRLSEELYVLMLSKCTCMFYAKIFPTTFHPFIVIFNVQNSPGYDIVLVVHLYKIIVRHPCQLVMLYIIISLLDVVHAFSLTTRLFLRHHESILHHLANQKISTRVWYA